MKRLLVLADFTKQYGTATGLSYWQASVAVVSLLAHVISIVGFDDRDIGV
ncbi:MAG: hypothetical protein LC687_02095 [Actinobacteria bacterium]|nr:hypothetical protein [Actinomycetota bacterium]